MTSERDMDLDDPQFNRLMNAWTEAYHSGEYEKADSIFEELTAWMTEQMENDPETQCDWFSVAMEYEESGNWDEAEKAYQENLLLKGNDWKALADLSSFYQRLGRNDVALEYAQRATGAAREFGIDIMLAMALHYEAKIQLHAKNLASAEALASEILEVLEEETLTAQLRGAALTLRALCRLKSDDLDAASRDLDASFALLEPLVAMESAAGVHGDIAQWYAVKGRLEAKRGNKDNAIQAWNMAIDRTWHVFKLYNGEGVGVNACLAQMLKQAAESLEQFGPNEQTATMLRESREIWDSLRLPPEAW